MRANTEVVAVAYLKQIAWSFPGVVVSTTIPNINDAAKGLHAFVVPIVVGGNADLTTPLANPVVQVTCYVLNAGKPDWGRASALAEDVRRNGILNQFKVLEVPNVTNKVRAGMATFTEPRRLQYDKQRFAAFTTDCVMTWIEKNYEN